MHLDCFLIVELSGQKKKPNIKRNKHQNNNTESVVDLFCSSVVTCGGKKTKQKTGD